MCSAFVYLSVCCVCVCERCLCRVFTMCVCLCMFVSVCVSVYGMSVHVCIRSKIKGRDTGVVSPMVASELQLLSQVQLLLSSIWPMN